MEHIIAKCRKLVGKFKHSEGLCRKLKAKQERLGLEFKLKLVQDVSTRWNSTFDMLETILINKAPLVSIALEPENAPHDIEMLCDQEFSIIKDLCTILEPLKELTEFLSASSYTTCAIVYPAIYSLVHDFLPDIQLYDGDMIELKEEFVEILKRRFHHILDLRCNGFFLAATYLDIQYRDMKFIKATDDSIEATILASEKRFEAIESAKRFITRIATEFPAKISNQQKNSMPSTSSDSIETPPGSVASTSSDARSNDNANLQNSEYMSRRLKKKFKCGFLSKLITVSQQPTVSTKVNNLVNEFENYEKLANNRNFNDENARDSQQRPLYFFNTYKNQLPELSRLARIILSVPTTSVPSESLFSSAGIIQNELRNRLNPATLDMLNFIKYNH